jgi:hypothetical protein
MKLTSENVIKITKNCLFKEEEAQDNAIIVECITGRFHFHPERLKSHEEDIKSMLSELPENFREDFKSQGWSFIAACDNNKGEQWTGMHRIMESLFALGMGVNRAKFLAPREMWNSLPGGMPYLSINVN